jgi:hypothetical protein
MFDIHIWLANSDQTGSNGDRRIIFSKIDRNNSNTNSGIEIGAEKILGLWAPYCLIRQAGVETEIKATTAFDFSFSTHVPKYLRVWRDENDFISFSFHGSVDGEEGMTWTTVAGSLTNSEDLLIGAGRSTSDVVQDRWNGSCFQIRVYTGGYKTEEQAHLIFNNAPTPLTMKFCGRVWKIKDTTNAKTLQCKSEGKVLLNTIISSGLLSTVHTGENATRTDDNAIFDAGQDNFDILQSIIKRADEDFVFYAEGASPFGLTGSFAAEGGFVKNAGLLLAIGNHDFFTLPRKVFVAEDNTGVTSPVVFNNGGERGEQVLVSGNDDSRVVNDLEIIGRTKPIHKTQGTATINSNNQVEPISHSPLNLRITRDDTNAVLIEGSASNYTVDFDKKEVTFVDGASIGSACTYEFDYEDLGANDYLYRRETRQASIDQHGRYARKLIMPQFNDQFNDISALTTKILNNNEDPIERVRVVVPTLYNAVRENHLVTVNNTTKGISGTKIVKQIEWRYPENKTFINCGEIEFDGYDWQVREGDSITGQASNMIKTKNL